MVPIRHESPFLGPGIALAGSMSQNIIRYSAARRQLRGRIGIAGVAQLAEHNVANVVVVGSNPITRSFLPLSLVRSRVGARAVMSTDAGDVASTEPEADEKQKLSLEIKVDSPSACERHVTVSVSREDIDRYFGDAVSELMPRAEVSGFRPGRAPRKLVEARFQSQLAEQVKGSVLMDTMTQVGDECDFSAISEPDFDFESIELPDEGPMTFEFNIEVRPEFEMPSWDGLTLSKPVQEITEDAVKERTKALLAREGKLADREDGAQAGDILTVNVEFSSDGEKLSSLEDQTVVLRPTLSFMDGELEGFDKLAEGAKTGDTIEGKVTISAGAENEQLRGKEVDATFSVTSVQFLEIPELNQQFLEKSADSSPRTNCTRSSAAKWSVSFHTSSSKTSASRSQLS